MCKQREILIVFSRDVSQFDFESSNSPFPHLRPTLKPFLFSLPSKGIFGDRIGNICLPLDRRVGTKFKYEKHHSRKILRVYGGGNSPTTHHSEYLSERIDAYKGGVVRKSRRAHNP